MAQFGKHLFGSSYFGQTSTFNGTYETAIIDADELFSGSIRVVLNAHLPVATYKGNDQQLALKTGFSISGEQATAGAAGATLQTLICGSTFILEGTGEATVTFKHIASETETTHTFSNGLTLEKEYADYLITIKTTSATFVLDAVKARVANIGIEVRSAQTLSDPVNFIPNWDSYNDVPLTYNEKDGHWEGDTPAVTDKRYVQLKLHLATSESTLSPVVDALHFSSGDLTKHAENGQWRCSLNMKNIARDKDKTFARVKRVEWVEKPQPNSFMTLRSASINGTHSSVPARGDIDNTSFWKAETAPYILKESTGGQPGTPWSRLSLAEAGNGFGNSSLNSSVMIGPIHPKSANLTNTRLVRWLEILDQSGYPTNTRGVDIVYALYKNRDDKEKGFAPIYRLSNPKDTTNRLITLAEEDQVETVYLEIQLMRTTGKGSPVVDYIDLNTQMHYEAPASVGNYTETLSPLDGILKYGEAYRGMQELRTVSSSLFDWPGLDQPLSANNDNLLANDRVIEVVYRPTYLNQVGLGLGEEMETTDRFKANTTKTWTFFSQTDAESPRASTESVPANRLVWHASYDGGTVNYPLVTERDLSSQFTPKLLEDKQYRFYIVNGWRDETFRLPVSMTWEEVEDVTGHSKEALIATNGTIKEYGGRLPMGYTLTLPNTTANNKVDYQFKSTKNRVTERSLWNGTYNDTVETWIPDGGDYTYTDWVSDEVLFDGIINPNDRFLPYVRTQSSVMNPRSDSTYRVEQEEETAVHIAQTFHVDVNDLKLRNNNQSVFHAGDEVLIPGTFTLPSLKPGLIYDGDNPYVVEIIPGSVRKTNDDRRLDEVVIQPGTDDEPAIAYTLVDSPAMTAEMTRGSIQNGSDVIPFTDVRQVLRVQDENGVVYVPYSSSGGSEMGDYSLKNNRIDWHPTHASAKEPAEGVAYTVTVIHGIVNTMRLVYSSDYSEKMAKDRLWRSAQAIEINGLVTPDEDFIAPLPAKTSFAGYTNDLKQTAYVVEDNDIWVKTQITKDGGEDQLFATLNGDDPSRNWYPEIQTGFYYIDDQEYYLYSEPQKQRFEEKDIPIIDDVTYTEDGLMLT